jgi:hypothetical protein
MADDYDLALQKGLIAALDADADLAALVGDRIYDAPPRDVAFPYVRVARFDVAPQDTDGTQAAEVLVTIEAHARPVAGRVECARIAGAIRVALHRKETDVTVAGFDLVELVFQELQIERIGDEGVEYRGTVLFRALIDAGAD